MSLTGAGPDIFSTSPRKEQRHVVPEKRDAGTSLAKRRKGTRVKVPELSSRHE
jgi:hypothetical protein